MATCRNCSAVIVWAKTEAGKRMPLDAEPVADGNLVLLGGIARAATAEEKKAGWKLYRPHWASCPQSDLWRRPR